VRFSTRTDFETASAGLNRDSDTPVTSDLLEWADVIFVMEPTHRDRLSRRFRSCLKNQRIICLNVADNYEFIDPKLVAELETKVAMHL
jgi:predicted protein tyrosine phosphatase